MNCQSGKKRSSWRRDAVLWEITSNFCVGGAWTGGSVEIKVKMGTVLKSDVVLTHSNYYCPMATVNFTLSVSTNCRCLAWALWSCKLWHLGWTLRKRTKVPLSGQAFWIFDKEQWWGEVAMVCACVSSAVGCEAYVREYVLCCICNHQCKLVWGVAGLFLSFNFWLYSRFMVDMVVYDACACDRLWGM